VNVRSELFVLAVGRPVLELEPRPGHELRDMREMSTSPACGRAVIEASMAKDGSPDLGGVHSSSVLVSSIGA
jgi:hypothetical protein